MLTFHVPALPHTITGDPRFSACPFTGIVERFTRAMAARGHRVIHYGNEGSRLGAGVEHVTIFSSRRQKATFKGKAWWDTRNIREFPWTEDNFAAWNKIAVSAIARRAQPRDFVCIIGGRMQKSLADVPGTMGVEYSVGYDPHGMFSRARRAFVSYAWMHYALGACGQHHGQFADTVIYPPVDPSAFRCQEKKDDYLLFLGHIMPSKGIDIAIEVARDAGRKLIVAGGGATGNELWVEYRGVVAPDERRRLLSGARAVLMPTTYVEPFGLVAVEAMMSGTPVVTTDWGAFAETIQHGRTGFRCHRHQEFVESVKLAERLDPHACRAHALRLCDPALVAERYEAWFAQLHDLWEDGYYSTRTICE